MEPRYFSENAVCPDCDGNGEHVAGCSVVDPAELELRSGVAVSASGEFVCVACGSRFYAVRPDHARAAAERCCSDGAAERAQRVVEELERDFWQGVAAAYPECPTGDFPPDADRELRAAMVRAVELWSGINAS